MSDVRQIIGVDSCKAGWVVAQSTTNDCTQIEIHIVSTFEEVAKGTHDNAVIAVDIPVGLLDSYVIGGRICDRLARKMIGPRKLSVFPPPVRPALNTSSYDEACRASRASSPLGKALSRQSYSLIPKICQVDAVLRENPCLNTRIFETHPEVAFFQLGNEYLLPKKKRDGRQQRIMLLQQRGIPDTTQLLPRSTQYQPDDILDAVVCLLVAFDFAHGTTSTLPEQPPLDRYGLPMRIMMPQQGTCKTSHMHCQTPIADSTHKKSSNESDLLAHIFSLAGGINAGVGDVLVGPGDDCAVVQTSSGDTLLLTVDQLVEGRHFSSDTPIDLIARKAVARSISDIAAMGGVPRWSLATGLLPDGYEHGKAMSSALHKWSRHWQAPMVGGDIAFGPGPLSLSVTVIGSMTSDALPLQTVSPIVRSGAKPGDLLWLSGPVGGSFASGHHLHFEPRLDVGRAAARANANSTTQNGVVHAMIDLSDGLGRDAWRVGKASGVVLEIDAQLVPTHSDQAGNPLPWMQACREGEDYELLLAIAPGYGETQHTLPEALKALDRPLLGPIGRVVECGDTSPEYHSKAGAVMCTADGTRIEAADLGFDHGMDHS